MQAILRSNSGDHELTIEFESAVEYAHESGLQATVRLKGIHWDGDHIHPLSVCVAGLWLRTDDLVELCRYISSWIERPLESLNVSDLNREFRLCRLPSQELDLTFGERSDAISGPNPVVSVRLVGGRLDVDYWFVTDQSCLRLFLEEVSGLISKSKQSRR